MGLFNSLFYLDQLHIKIHRSNILTDISNPLYYAVIIDGKTVSNLSTTTLTLLQTNS